MPYAVIMVRAPALLPYCSIKRTYHVAFPLVDHELKFMLYDPFTDSIAR
jgi:hypothetical protein